MILYFLQLLYNNEITKHHKTFQTSKFFNDTAVNATLVHKIISKLYNMYKFDNSENSVSY